MKIEGFKADNYNATYSPALFDIRKGRENNKSCVLIIEDMQAGTEFIFELNKDSENYKLINQNIKQKSRVKNWHK